VRLVTVLLDRGAVGVLHLCIDAKNEHRLIHRCQSRGKRTLTSVGALLVFAEEQYIDCQRNPRRQPKKRVDLSLTLQLRWF